MLADLLADSVDSATHSERTAVFIVCLAGLAIYSLLGLPKTTSWTRAVVLMAFSAANLLTGVLAAVVQWCDVDMRFKALALAISGLATGVLWPPWVFFRVAVPGEAGVSRWFHFLLCISGALLIWIGCVGLVSVFRLWQHS